MDEQDRLQAILVKDCEDYFPYACTAQKTQMQDGSVSCECGAKISNPLNSKEPKA